MELIVADTSFLFSLFGNDVHSDAAGAWALQSKLPITVSILNRYEFGHALRFAVFRKAISEADSTRSLAAFETDLRIGNLRMAACDMNEVILEATRLSELQTVVGGHRSFDILHVATAKVLKAKTLLTFDANQRGLAEIVRLKVGP